MWVSVEWVVIVIGKASRVLPAAEGAKVSTLAKVKIQA
jgi:hypothetical protein